MLAIYQNVNGAIKPVEGIYDNVWVHLISPSDDEINRVAHRFHIDAEDIRAPLDNEESSRVEVNDDYLMILIDIPLKEKRHDNDAFVTIPLSIILVGGSLITICLKDTDLLKPFIDGRIRGVEVHKRVRFTYQILFRNASLFQSYLRSIDAKRKSIEADLEGKTRNTDLIQLHELESNLVYFATSLQANAIVFDKLSKSERIVRYDEDQELLEDAIIENKQAIEMTRIYRDILNGTRELFASVIDNNLNTVMKFMTSITLIMAIPTIISGFYGMNVNAKGMPFVESPHAFLIIACITAVICIVMLILLRRRNLL